MLATLYVHALESHRRDGLSRDPRAEELVARIGICLPGCWFQQRIKTDKRIETDGFQVRAHCRIPI